MVGRAFLAAVAALAVVAVLVPISTAQAPARAAADARVAAGDLGRSGHALADGDERDAADGAAAADGLEIASGRATARAARARGAGSARAAATARGVSLFGGAVSAAVVRRSATAADGAVAYDGEVRALVVSGQPHGDLSAQRTFSAGGVRVTVNAAGTGLRARLTRAVAGFAAGTTVTIAQVAADAADGADPAATPAPTATPRATAIAQPTAEPTATPAPRKPRITAAQRLARRHFVFPVYGRARVADDFGAPRQHTGSHEGNDVFAAFGSPVLAVADGRLNRVGTLPISGNRLWLKTDRGDAFFYAHLSAFAPEAVSGRRVQAGTLLGFVGNTGDAEPTPPHLHFEIHPGDRKPIDPHPVLLAWQDRRTVPAGGWLARYGDDTAPRPGALTSVRDFIADG
jgi:murein DD-endopeptidase MepM/ murein hydrolase activator NlpD